MIQINRLAIDSLEEASTKRQKRYNLGKFEDLLVVEESVKVNKVVLGRRKLEDYGLQKNGRLKGHAKI